MIVVKAHLVSFLVCSHPSPSLHLEPSVQHPLLLPVGNPGYLERWRSQMFEFPASGLSPFPSLPCVSSSLPTAPHSRLEYLRRSRKEPRCRVSFASSADRPLQWYRPL